MPNSSLHPPLVLVHGFRGAPIGLLSIANELCHAGYQVFVPPIPPCRQSPETQASKQERLPALSSASPDSAKYYVDYLLQYMKLNHIDQPVLIGHSMGSIICAAIAHSHPQTISQKLILLSPITGHTPAFFSFISPLSALAPARLVDYSTTRYLFTPHDRALLKSVLSITRQCSSCQSRSRTANLAAARFAAHNTIEDFLPIHKDILLLAGAKDRLVSQKKTRSLAEKLSHSSGHNPQLVFLSNTGHLHNYEQPLETSQAILNFLQQ